jgi:hypothetical protein
MSRPRYLRHRRSAASMGQKLDNTLKLWREQNITIQDFIKAWVCDRQAGGSGYSAARRVNGLKRALQQPDVARILSRETVPEVSGVGTLQDELDALVGRPLFDRYNAEASVGDLDNLTFEGARNEIVRWAPQWANLLDQLLQNTRASWQSYCPPKKTSYDGAMYLITSIICRARAKKRSNFFAKMFGVYLHGSGTRRRVIEVLSGLGVCDTYKVINEQLTKVASRVASE